MPRRSGQQCPTDRILGMRIARKSSAVPLEDGHEAALARIDRSVKVFEILGPDRYYDSAEEFVDGSADAACDKDEPPAAIAIFDRRLQETGRLISQAEILDKMAAREICRRSRAVAGRIDQPALRIGQGEVGGLREILQSLGKELAPLSAGEHLFELRRGLDARVGYPVLDLIQNKVDGLQSA